MLCSILVIKQEGGRYGSTKFIALFSARMRHTVTLNTMFNECSARHLHLNDLQVIQVRGVAAPTSFQLKLLVGNLTYSVNGGSNFIFCKVFVFLRTCV